MQDMYHNCSTLLISDMSTAALDRVVEITLKRLIEPIELNRRDFDCLSPGRTGVGAILLQLLLHVER